jgi:hypothetical protein
MGPCAVLACCVVRSNAMPCLLQCRVCLSAALAPAFMPQTLDSNLRLRNVRLPAG